MGSHTDCRCLPLPEPPSEQCPVHGLDAEFAQQQAYEEGLQRWAEMYDELNGAPENEEDR